MASPTWWAWVWVSSMSWWWTGKPGMLQSMGSQRVIHDWVTELPEWSSGFPYFLQFKSEFCNNEFMIIYMCVCVCFYVLASAATAKSLQSCPTLCDTIDCSPPGSSVPGILQARILEWVATSFSNTYMHANCFCRVWLCVTLWTAARQAPLSTGFSRQEYWSGLLFPSPD